MNRWNTWVKQKDMSEIIEGAYGTGINKCDGADNGNNLMVAEGKLERSGI